VQRLAGAAVAEVAREPGEFRRGWPVVLSALLGIGLGLSPLPFYTAGLFAPELARAFHWGFGQIMGGLTVMTVLILGASPIVGLLADRYGVRRVALTSLVLFAISFGALAASNGSLLLFYCNWALIALLGAGTLPITWTRPVNNSFEVHKGLALGLSLVGTGLFGFLIKPTAAWLIATVGWRVAYVAIGFMPLIIALPVALLWFHDREAGSAEPRRLSLGATGYSFGEARRDWRFWVLALALVPIAFAGGGPISNMENILATAGFVRSDIVRLVPLLGLSVMVGRALGGWLIDRVWAPAVACVLLCLVAIACWMLARHSVSFATALGCIVAFGFASGIEYDLMGFLVARYFGMRSYGAIYGVLYGFFSLGAGVGPLVYGAVFDATGAYARALLPTSGALIVGALMLLTLGRYRSFSRAGD
jgi:MFS family permease